MNDLCPICLTEGLATLDVRGSVPILMNKCYRTAEEGRRAPRGSLKLMRCRACGFVWNASFDPSLIVYDASYENDQTQSAALYHAIDINPTKQARYLPDSGTLLLSSAARNSRTVHVKNPDYPDEIRVNATEAGITAQFVPINSETSQCASTSIPKRRPSNSVTAA